MLNFKQQGDYLRNYRVNFSLTGLDRRNIFARHVKDTLFSLEFNNKRTRQLIMSKSTFNRHYYFLKIQCLPKVFTILN